MPPSIDAMVANLATLLAGHVPVNIDAAMFLMVSSPARI
jgi:hypothetical protein